MSRKFTPAEIRQRMSMIESRLSVANPAPSAEASNRSTIRLKITDVEPYDHNPRTIDNEKFYEIKESIRVNGIEQKVLVTKRPGAARYIVAKGGNTRVLAARALWDETQDEKHLWYDFDCIDYTSEVELMAGHLRENDQRNDLCFWNRATGYLQLKQLIEQEQKRELSLREFSRLLDEQGTRVSPPLLSVFRFAVDNLSGLQQAATQLSGTDVQERIQPALASLGRLGSKLQHPADWVMSAILPPCLEIARVRHEQVGELDVPALVESFYQKTASLLDVPRSGIDAMLNILDKVPDVTADTLRSAAVGVTLRTAGAPANDPGGNDLLDGAAPNAGDGSPSDENGASAPQPMPAAPAAPPARTNGSRVQGAVERPAGTTLAGGTAPSHDPAPAAPSSPADVQAQFWQALTRFADACGVADLLVATDTLPLGFLIEPPLPPAGTPPMDAQAAEGNAPHRYYGWWWLVHLSQQNTPAGLTVLPADCRFAVCARTEEAFEAACDAVLGEPVLADRFYRLVLTMLDPLDPIGALYLDLIVAVRALRGAHPERFGQTFWLDQGVDPRVIDVED